MQSNKEIKVRIVTDFACPWCYVGFKRYHNAIDAFRVKNPQIAIKNTYHPYMIDPQTKSDGEEYLAYNRRRWGGDGWAQSMKSEAKSDGCTFKSWKIWPNTLIPHQLLLYGTQFDKQDDIEKVLLRMCYEDGKNISLLETVLEAASEVGLREGAQNYVGTEQGRKDVIKRDREAKNQSIDGVPYFVITLPNGEEVNLSGAQETETFLKVFEYACQV